MNDKRSDSDRRNDERRGINRRLKKDDISDDRREINDRRQDERRADQDRRS